MAQIRADIEVTCFQYEGINAIKRALMKGLAHGGEEMPIKIKLVAPPLYVMTCSALDKARRPRATLPSPLLLQPAASPRCLALLP